MGLNGSDGRKHRYQLCDDEDCELPYCRIYKEGYLNGREDGYRDGYGAGYADGYAQGFPDGIDACPRPHNG